MKDLQWRRLSLTQLLRPLTMISRKRSRRSIPSQKRRCLHMRTKFLNIDRGSGVSLPSYHLLPIFSLLRIICSCRAQIASTRATSLIPQTLEEMASDTEQQKLQQLLNIKGQAALTREERRKRQRSLDAIDAPSFYALCEVQPFCTVFDREFEARFASFSN